MRLGEAELNIMRLRQKGMIGVNSAGLDYIGSKSLIAITDGCPNLTEVHLRSWKVCAPGLKYLCSNLKHLKRLEVFRIFDRHLKSIATSTTLETLKLPCYYGISYECLTNTLEQLAPSLRYLVVTWSRINNKFFNVLQKKYPHIKIEHRTQCFSRKA